ncbi:little elongation complex subunit 1-like [Anneissia japonica]|uniref:little elongation complex subunit 1-like n=1 Tax=Anneissia japonica TaxID=1529436 RepID=UPI001425667A|nr:little elongation complex subunit 1-like [Anneissia japonica]
MTLSRCYTALCHCKGLAYADHVRILLYDVINQKADDAPHLILSIISAWPSVLQMNTSSPVDTAVKIIVSHQLQCQLENGQYTATILQKCFNQLYDWPIVMSQTLDKFCIDLVKKLTDENVAIVTTNADGDSILSPASYDLVKAVELVAGQLGWAWIKYQLIDQVLWPMVEYWKSKVRGSHSINEGSICAVLQIIGELSTDGLSCDQESVMELLAKVGTLLQVDHTASVSWIIQIFVVKTLMRLSPSNPQSVRELIGGWMSKSTQMIPAVIRNAFTTLTRNAESQ